MTEHFTENDYDLFPPPKDRPSMIFYVSSPTTLPKARDYRQVYEITVEESEIISFLRSAMKILLCVVTILASLFNPGIALISFYLAIAFYLLSSKP